MRRFDLMIIGTGSGNSIIGPEHDTLDVALIERGVFGGTCLNVGCIPSKMFVYASEIAELADDSRRLGISTSFDGADWPAIRDRVFGRIDPIASAGRDYRLSLPNVTVFEGSACFTGPKELLINDEAITADHIVIAAGAHAVAPDVPGLADVGFHTSDTIMRIDEPPHRLAVIGGGYIAAELGGVMGTFGSEVTFVLRGDTFVRNEDLDVRARFTEICQEKYPVLFDTHVVSVRRDGGEIVLDVATDDHHQELVTDEVLVAIGREPNSHDLGVGASGIAVDDGGYVVTDSFMRTNVDGVWALGDITNPAQLKHVANHEARVVRHNLSNPDHLMAVDHRFIPHAIFGHPQIAGVGLTEQQCQADQVPYVSHVQPYGSTAYGWAMEDATSFVKVIAHADTRQLIGAHILGPQASTLIQQLIQGMHFGQTVDEMARGQYYIHPALSEVVEQALLEL